MQRNTDLPNRASEKFLARASHTQPESEKTLEARLRREVEKLGGKALKLSAQMHRGLPDRMVLLPPGQITFVEMKTTGKKPTKLQEKCHRELRSLGFDVYVVDSTESLEGALADMEKKSLFAKTASLL